MGGIHRMDNGRITKTIEARTKDRNSIDKPPNNWKEQRYKIAGKRNMGQSEAKQLS